MRKLYAEAPEASGKTERAGDTVPMRESYSHLMTSWESEPWISSGVTAQRPPRLLLTLLGDYWWQRTEPSCRRR